jgi:hypothetical protein
MMNTKVGRGQASLATGSPGNRREAGAALRREVPRSAQGEWAQQADPVEILIERELLPTRYRRMRADPFAFLRGAPAVMPRT